MFKTKGLELCALHVSIKFRGVFAELNLLTSQNCDEEKSNA